MEINFLGVQTRLISHVSKKDLKYFEKNPFGNVSTKANNRGLRTILSLGKENSASINGSIVSLVITKEKLALLSKSEATLFHLPKNSFRIQEVEIYLEMS